MNAANKALIKNSGNNAKIVGGGASAGVIGISRGGSGNFA
jgi:hypothetical protein